jgi:hypothetical protein
MRLKDFLKESVVTNNISGHLYISDANGTNRRLNHDYSNIDVDGDVDISSCDFLENLIGSPRSCLDYIIQGCPSLVSLQGGTNLVKGLVAIWGSRHLTSLTGIGKDYFREVHETFQVPLYITSNILGLVRIKKLKTVVFYKGAQPPKDYIECVIEINKQLETDRDLMACKEAMIALGHKEYAKL